MYNDDVLLHLGTKRHSGRYPYGSGEEPSKSAKFLIRYNELKNEGLSEVEIAEKMDMNTTKLRNFKTWALDEDRRLVREGILKDKAEGILSNVAIGEKYGVSEGTVRKTKPLGEDHKENQIANVEKALIEGVKETGYLDVGVGVELQIGVPRNRFNSVVNKLVEEQGYFIHEIRVRRMNDKTGKNPVDMKVLTKDPDSKSTWMNQDKISNFEFKSYDRCETISNINEPQSVHPDRVMVRYKEDGGELKDGVLELRPGVEDLDMGPNRYAQVRVKVGDNKYMKGMAVYGDPKDFPDGVDVIYNSKKDKSTPKNDVFKTTKEDGDNIFGSSISGQNASNVINYVNQAGEWDTWSRDLSSQFLSKQPAKLIKERLDATHDALRKDLDELSTLTNPLVKQYLVDKYSQGLETKAANLKAKGMPGIQGHVILPFPDMNPNEVYAPNYNDGDRVVLVRYPHGGVFELPELTVNNKNQKAKEVMGVAVDAIGVHPSAAQKLSGADFDGDTVYVIPNNDRKIKTSRSLKELKNFDPMDYKLPKDPNKKKPVTEEEKIAARDELAKRERIKQTEMGKVSNLITDMTLKDASESEIAKAVKHSMVVIDSVKHDLDFRQSEIDNSISMLKKKYQQSINPDTGKPSIGASTIISRSKRHIDISQDETVRELLNDKIRKDGTISKKGLTPEEVAKQLHISKETVEGYAKGESFNPYKYSSGRQAEELYAGYITQLQSLKREADSISKSIQPPKYNAEAAKIYKDELVSLNRKIEKARLNAPRERQAQIMANKLYYTNMTKDMTKDQKKKLRARSLARARATVGVESSYVIIDGKRVKDSIIDITPKEWKAIQSNALTANKLKEVLKYGDMDQIRDYSTPRTPKMNNAKVQRAKILLDKGYTYAQVSEAIGVSVSTIKDEVSDG